MNTALEQLLNQGAVWQGMTPSDANPETTVPMPLLDPHLPRSVMQHRLIDVHAPLGIGELTLLLEPIGDYLQHQSRLLVFIAPPFMPCADALRDFKLELDRVWVISPQSHKDTLWALETCLSHQCVFTVLAWLGNITPAQGKRLRLAARQGDTHAILYRPPKSLPLSHSLSLALTPKTQNELQVTVMKVMGGWSPAPFSVSTPPSWEPL